MSATSIEWTDAVWNPTRGCSLVSPGCRNCYAMRQAHRFSGPGQPYEGLTKMTQHGPVWTGNVRIAPDMLPVPMHWRKPRRVFVDSMSDLFHEGLSNEEIAEVFGVMAKAFWHTFQVLTKRPERMLEWFRWAAGGRHVWPRAQQHEWAPWAMRAVNRGQGGGGWPLRNVWLGVSVEDQQRAEDRIPELLQTPAATRFVSYEPALGPVDFTEWLLPTFGPNCARGPSNLNWIIVGGESGPGARPFELDWARSTVRACKAAGVPCFVKQLGACASDPVNGIAGAALDVPQEALPLVGQRLKDRKGGDTAEWPEALRVREFPASQAP